MTVRSDVRPVVVASVPAGHVYVRHLSVAGAEGGVVRLPDPRPATASSVEQWWPPVMLDAGWVRAHAGSFDVMHVHFGFDALAVDDLTDLVRALREVGRPLVLTVHDLRNPHHGERHLHDAQLAVLVPAAAEVMTLTGGAALEIRRRWGREATVLPHPHVVPADRLGRVRPDHQDFVVGVHCKSLRAGLDPLPVIEVLAATVATLPAARLRVDAHTDVMRPDASRYSEALAVRLTHLADRGLVELHVHDYFSDAELWDYLASLDLSVLPYRFGTHSGWLEACHDLGTAVLVSDCGHHAEQRPCLVYPLGHDGLPDPRPLAERVREAHRTRPAWQADPFDRATERSLLATQHLEVYRRALRAR